MRGEKNPGTPNMKALAVLIWSSIGRIESIDAGGMNGSCAETRCQNSRRRSTRRSGGLPAISAALMAPIETPATQSGAAPHSARPS